MEHVLRVSGNHRCAGGTRLLHILMRLVEAQVHPVDVEMRPGEAVTVMLQLRPQRPGLLALRGLQWRLAATAPSRHLFEPPRSRDGAIPRSWPCPILQVSNADPVHAMDIKYQLPARARLWLER